MQTLFRVSPISFPEVSDQQSENERLWGQPCWNNKGSNRILPIPYPVSLQSRSQSFVPQDQRSENESSGSNHYERTILVIRFTAHLHLWRMPEMVALRALVFRPLVKGNEALGTRTVSLRSLHLWRMPGMVALRALVFRPLVKGNKDSGNEIRVSLTVFLKHRSQSKKPYYRFWEGSCEQVV